MQRAEFSANFNAVENDAPQLDTPNQNAMQHYAMRYIAKSRQPLPAFKQQLLRSGLWSHKDDSTSHVVTATIIPVDELLRPRKRAATAPAVLGRGTPDNPIMLEVD